MSVGPMGGLAGSAAGSSLAQTKGSEVERAAQDTASQKRRIHTDAKAESAAGIGETDGEDHESAERDADGRRIWEDQRRGEPDAQDGGDLEAPPTRQSRDATGTSGNQLDLTG